MFRTSSTIMGANFTTNDVPRKREAFQEIQNIIAIDLTDNHFSTDKSFKATTNSSSSQISVDDTISLASETQVNETESFSDSSSLNSNDSLTILNSNDEESTEEYDSINYKLVKHFLKPHDNVYTFGNENFLMTQDTFLQIVETVETFNQVVYNLYSDEIQIETFDLPKFSKSILTSTEHYFFKSINQLIKIFIYSKQSELNEMQMFNLNTLNLINNRLLNSAKTVVLILLKIINHIHSLKNQNVNEKSFLFSKYNSPLEERIDSAKCLNELSKEEKLELFSTLIDACAFLRPKFYRSKIIDFENQIDQTGRTLNRLQRQRFDFEIKYANFRNFLFEDSENSMNDNNYLVDLSHQINTNNKSLIDLNSHFEGLMRRGPFSQLEVLDENFVLFFWYFECLKNSLVIEKRFKTGNYDFESDTFDFNEEKSEWFVISDEKILKDFVNVIGSNFYDSKFIDGCLKCMEKSYVVEGDSEIKTDNDDEKNEDESSLETVLLDFRDRLVEANFIHYEIFYDKSDWSVNSFQISDSYQKFCQISLTLKNQTEINSSDRINIYIEMVQALYGMINRKFINNKFTLNHESIWQIMVSSSKTLEQMKFCLFLLENNLNWEKTKIAEMCNICQSENPSESFESTLKIQCKNCPVIYHLTCLTKPQNQVENDMNNNLIPVKMFKSKLNKFAKLLCRDCEQKMEDEFKATIELNQHKCEEVAKQLKSIEVNNYSLRFNKLRATNIDNRIQQNETRARRKQKKDKFIVSDTDETNDGKSTDSEYKQPLKKTRGRKRVKVVESSSSQSDAPYEKRKTRSRTNKRKNEESESDFEPKEEVKAEEDFEAETRRIRLGLRARPKKLERMF
ncbi:unnamed protein product [Brachionus calyciflorus]|uniref:Zinc finger PHD-type domain-containing protein n=1 Tax=Brachionus calyciflorus TaxID=104777 RepID=A0A813UVP3_9BILA|nr:unnamed protein product [Brachionus calyciflorus]